MNPKLRVILISLCISLIIVAGILSLIDDSGLMITRLHRIDKELTFIRNYPDEMWTFPVAADKITDLAHYEFCLLLWDGDDLSDYGPYSFTLRELDAICGWTSSYSNRQLAYGIKSLLEEYYFRQMDYLSLGGEGASNTSRGKQSEGQEAQE